LLKTSVYFRLNQETVTFFKAKTRWGKEEKNIREVTEERKRTYWDKKEGRKRKKRKDKRVYGAKFFRAGKVQGRWNGKISQGEEEEGALWKVKRLPTPLD